MKIIDIHTHFYPKFAAEAPESWAKQTNETYWGALVGKRPDGKKSLQGFPSEKKFLDDMDAAGVERSVVQGWYWQNSQTCQTMNLEIARFAKSHPDRISAFASIQPADAERAIETIKSARDLGFCGIGELHDGVQDFEFLSSAFDDIAAAAAEEKLPICLHITESSQRKYHGKVGTSTAHAIEAARSNQSTTFIFAHWCGGEIFPSPQSFAGLSNVYFDSAASPLTNDNSAWEKASAFFPQNSLYGSDYPLRLYPRLFEEEEMLTIVETAKKFADPDAAEDFFYKNAQRILGL